MYRRYILKDQPFVQTPEMKWGNDVHEAFEKRVGQQQALPVNMQQWEHFARPFDKFKVLVEQKLGITAAGKACEFFGKDVWFRGKGDNIVIEGVKAMITDWKTSKTIREDPFELETNAVLLKAKFPQLEKIVGRYAWVTHNQLGQMHDLSDVVGTWQEIQRLMLLIKEKQTTGEWEKRRSGLCGWCPVEDCEHFFISEKRKQT